MVGGYSLDLSETSYETSAAKPPLPQLAKLHESILKT